LHQGLAFRQHDKSEESSNIGAENSEEVYKYQGKK
jgi:hypothetical protein